MVESSGDAISKGIDSSVGGLVWVQRRNGRWWPGMIIGPDELPQQPSSWPRSRTPVKLLGREDDSGSVDWYNIEKSKRVKAFRCGEYDEWITKANDSPKNSNKKAMKHVCRDDAIRHALKLERALVSKKDQECCCSGDDHNDSVLELVKMSPLTGIYETKVDKINIFDNNSTQELCLSGLSFEDPRQVSSMSRPNGSLPKNSGNLKVDELEGTPGVGRFKSFGLGVVRDGEDLRFQKDGFFHSNLDMENNFSIQSHSNGRGRDHSSQLKRKRPSIDSVKKKNRHRPLVKVLECTNEVSVPLLFDMTGGPSQSEFTGLSENNEGKIEYSRPKCFSMSVLCTSLHKKKLNFDDEACNGETGPETGQVSHHRFKDQTMSSSLKTQEEGLDGTLLEVPFARKVDAESEGTDAPGGVSGRERGGVAGRGRGSPERRNVGTVVSRWRQTGKRKSRKRQQRTEVDWVDLIPHAYWVGADNWDDLSSSTAAAGWGSETRRLGGSSGQGVAGIEWMWDVVVQADASCPPRRAPLTSVRSGADGRAIVGHSLAVEVVGRSRVDADVAGRGACVGVSAVFGRLMEAVGGRGHACV